MATSGKGFSDRLPRLFVIMLLCAAAFIMAAMYLRLHPRLDVERSAHAPTEFAPDDVTPIADVSARRPAAG